MIFQCIVARQSFFFFDEKMILSNLLEFPDNDGSWLARWLGRDSYLVVAWEACSSSSWGASLMTWAVAQLPTEEEDDDDDRVVPHLQTFLFGTLCLTLAVAVGITVIRATILQSDSLRQSFHRASGYLTVTASRRPSAGGMVEGGGSHRAGGGGGGVDDVRMDTSWSSARWFRGSSTGAAVGRSSGVVPSLRRQRLRSYSDGASLLEAPPPTAAGRPRVYTGGTTGTVASSEAQGVGGSSWWPSFATTTTAATTTPRTRIDSYTNHFEEDDDEYYEFTPPFYWEEDGDHGRDRDEGGDYSHKYYYGPHKACLSYDTWTPPPSWTETAMTILPYQHRLPLQRIVELQLSSVCTVRILPPGVPATTTVTPSPSSPAATTAATGSTISSTTFPSEPALELPVDEMSTHIQHAEGAVLHLYVKESSREEWMEHTFPTAADCAQFQTDLLALQLLGQAIFDMYQALEVLHQGSMASPAPELVVHDRSLNLDSASSSSSDAPPSNPPIVQSRGIAWDDVIRCLGGSFPSIRYRLEALWWKHALPVTPRRRHRQSAAARNRSTGAVKSAPQSVGGESAPAGSSLTDDLSGDLTEDYIKRRLLLGPIDFFRLFAPTVPHQAVPRVGANAARVEQLLRWRKRVARASVLVQAYVDAKVVANVGWNLSKPLPEGYWKRRLSFDDNMDNVRWDSSRENEYYEATVSRDIHCRVRGIDSLWKHPRWHLGFGRQLPQYSPIQGYLLVGIHTFRIDADSPLQPNVNPVEALPTLKTLVEDNPDLDFFITSLYPVFINVAFCQVSVFVRWLPKGIDISFDTSVRLHFVSVRCSYSIPTLTVRSVEQVERYMQGSSEDRDQRLEVIFQLQSNQDGMSWTTWIMLMVVSFLARFTFSGDSPPSQASKTGDRTVLPAMRLSLCGDSYHFGGALGARSCGRILNYAAHSWHLDSRKNVNLVSCMDPEPLMVSSLACFSFIYANCSQCASF